MTKTKSEPAPAYLLPIFLGSAPFAFLNFGLPIYTRSLGADAVAIGGMYTALTMLFARPLVGWALDRYGRRWLTLPWLLHILWVAVLYTLFSAGWALASPAQDALLGT